MHQSSPETSVIVPMYNAEDYIVEAIQSVIQQSHTHWELLLIDDGSTDQTKNIIKPFLDDDRIRYFYQENNGQASARNRGIQKAKGTYVAFLDADDLWHKDKLQTQLKILRAKEVCLVFSSINCITSEGKNLNRKIGSNTGEYQGFIAFFLLAGGNISIPNSSVMARKESIKQTGNFDERDEVRNLEDYNLWFRMLLRGCKFYGMDQVLGSYRIHKNQTTFDNPGLNLKMVNHLTILSKNFPDKYKYFKFLILLRLAAYYKQHNNKEVAKERSITIYNANACINSYWIEKHLMAWMGVRIYLKFRGLLIRKFRKFNSFVAVLNS